jgi:hypothetical protein
VLARVGLLSLLVAVQAMHSVATFSGNVVGMQAIEATPNYVCGDRVARWRRRWQGVCHSLPLVVPGYHLPVTGLTSRGWTGWVRRGPVGNRHEAHT